MIVKSHQIAHYSVRSRPVIESRSLNRGQQIVRVVVKLDRACQRVSNGLNPRAPLHVPDILYESRGVSYERVVTIGISDPGGVKGPGTTYLVLNDSAVGESRGR